MPKNTTQCPWPGLEPGPLDPELSALTMRPPHLPIIPNFYPVFFMEECFCVEKKSTVLMCDLIKLKIFPQSNIQNVYIRQSDQILPMSSSNQNFIAALCGAMDHKDGAPYPCRKAKETHELILSWLSRLAV